MSGPTTTVYEESRDGVLTPVGNSGYSGTTAILAVLFDTGEHEGTFVALPDAEGVRLTVRRS